jgi:hypothetical protein
VLDDAQGEQIVFESRDAVEAPGGVGDSLYEVLFGFGFGLVFEEEPLAVGLVSDQVIGGEDDGLAGESVAESVEGRTLFAGFGARAGGVLGIGAVDGRAIGGWGCWWMVAGGLVIWLCGGGGGWFFCHRICFLSINR